LGVVGYHTGLPGFASGFVGVDVFFVISGYLIINQIRSHIEAERFSILSFYARRVLRILPSFLLVLLVVTLAAPFFLTTPADYVDFSWSAIWSSLMVSNVFFYLSQGYFDIAAIQKPLLHTWTLSVEEQFYLVAPALLLGIFRLSGRRFGGMAVAAGLILAAVSLTGAIVWSTAAGPNPAFYLAQWRAWEFIAGGLIAPRIESIAARMPRAAAEFVAAGALALIVMSTVALHEGEAYPSYWATLPVGGAALSILSVSAQPRTLAARLLAHRSMVAIGLVSYGWYLWHWPILSFTRILRLGEASPVADVLTGGLLAFLLACATYRYVERPVRHWRQAHSLKRPSRIVAGGLVFSLATLLICALINLGAVLTVRSVVTDRYGVKGKGTLGDGCNVSSAVSLPTGCLQGEFGLLLGDSQAGSYAGSFTRFFQERNIRLTTIWRGACDPFLLGASAPQNDRNRGCADLLVPFEQALAAPKPPKFVIIASIGEYREPTTELLSNLIGRFDPSRTRILLIAPIPIFDKPGLSCVVLSDRYYRDRTRCDRPRAEAVAANAPLLATFKSGAERFPQIRYIDPTGLFCDPQTCRMFSANTVFYGDGKHVTPAGADRVLDGFEGDFHWLTDAM
jgi:peptidoglycan/LPS O-acetylase OafA/YrhL